MEDSRWATRQISVDDDSCCRQQARAWLPQHIRGQGCVEYGPTPTQRANRPGTAPGKAPRPAAWTKVKAMVGLEAVESTMQNMFCRVVQNYRRSQQGKKPIQAPLNQVFLEPPGTGKTRVAKLYAQILADLGLLSSGKVIIRNPSDFIDPYQGQSERRTRSILQKAKGKVLIIDDAYMLYLGSGSDARDGPDAYRILMFDILVAELDNSPGSDRCVILLGYQERMQEMFRKSNPGLARRFDLAHAIHFTDYTVHQLGQILDSESRPGRIQRTYCSHIRVRDPEDPVFTPRDFDLPYNRHLQAAAECEAHFQELIGIDEIVHQLQEYQTAVAGMRRNSIDARPYIPFTFVFRGPPGTAKTSTARKMGQIFYDMGFLSAPELIECSTSDLIASSQGQTRQRVTDWLERALGKVLFIDEAYRLASGGYERQAVDELVDRLTKTRYAQKLVVMLAGYDREMSRLMQINRGLRSRFPTEVFFYPLSAEACWKLMQKELTSVAIEIVEDGSGSKAVVEMFAKLAKMQSWASARDVKRLGGELVRQCFGGKADDSKSCLGVEGISWHQNLALRKASVSEAEMIAAAL
ncbi:hypothetical protein N7517_003903 [Penicillium concentricum]|uniref:AAA+ ATPase domain-containing protein n=1 Tax=Penicillium concentricum TaxID=293559 RepID=A0A9W9S570_9EURO|nr:uncharacterized protein N7517_003903 [Penicillium concentricum]KAJ5371897.1 hypothetical protein N7517_003903 [Penicillium concentricum]